MTIYHISYGRVQGSGYNACTGKYCIICPGGTKKKKNTRYFFETGSAMSLKIYAENIFKKTGTDSSLNFSLLNCNSFQKSEQ
jgi:hypothetical protein